MLTLITGGSKCGKSQYAEELLKGIVQHKFYLATMKPFGKEAEAAISRHRIMRQDKHFTTIEQYTDVNHLNLPNDSSVLLDVFRDSDSVGVRGGDIIPGGSDHRMSAVHQTAV